MYKYKFNSITTFKKAIKKSINKRGKAIKTGLNEFFPVKKHNQAKVCQTKKIPAQLAFCRNFVNILHHKRKQQFVKKTG